MFKWKKFFCVGVFLVIVAGGFALEAGDHNLDSVLGLLSATIRWDPFLRRGSLEAQGHSCFFVVREKRESGPVVFDNRVVFSTDTPYYENGELLFPESFTETVRQQFEDAILDDAARFRIAAIIIDPGHGGKDGGAVGTQIVGGTVVRTVEKDVTLNVGKKLEARLRSAYPDKRILMTRTADTFPSLEDRANLANKVQLADNEAVIYISIHANSSFKKDARGFEVWYLPPDYRREVIQGGVSSPLAGVQNVLLEEEFTKESVMMAQSIVNEWEKTFGLLIPSRGIKTEEWYVVRKSRMPAVLVELGFVSNAEDAAFLRSDSELQKMSDVLYNGMREFITKFEMSGGFIALK
jgi:N-acetylmuramoyl-L-alanine amidase